MISLRQQLAFALDSKGWTMSRLLSESGLDCDRSSLHRKIYGGQLLRVEECQVLAKTLGIELTWAPATPRASHALRKHGTRKGRRA